MGLNVAVVGAGGAVGCEMVRMLEKRKFPVKTLKLLATERSAGRKVMFNGEEYTIEVTRPESFQGIDLALFSAGGGPSKYWAPIAASYGVRVIDNSSAWRMEPDIPLVVPEVNAHVLTKEHHIIANPNCSTIQMVVVLKPLHDVAKIKRVVVSTYQSVSGTGHKAITELEEQVRAFVNGMPMQNKVYPYQIAFNVLPHIDVFDETGYTKEEWKMVNETKKIMGDNSIKVTATTVRVPVFRGHSEAVNIETEKKLTPQEAREILAKAPGVTVVDDPAQNKYPLPIMAEGQETTYVGRIREDFTIPNGLNMWIVSDNLLKGAALNAVQIAEYMLAKGFLSRIIK